MKKILTSLAFAAASTLMASHASAGLTTWEDTVTQTVRLGTWNSHSYTHSILDEGFIPAPGMQALSAQLKIDIWDDAACDPVFIFCIPENVSPESILITVDKFDFDSGTIAWGVSDFSGELEFQAMLSLNANGTLDVEITSLLGDFYVGNSTLTVQGVPEPETLGLMGFSLLGLAFLRRRQQAKA